jgi:hypothetical protein
MSRAIVASARKYPYWLRPHLMIIRGGPANDQMRRDGLRQAAIG